MAGDAQADVTTLLDAIRAGKADAQDELVARIYAELRRLAAGLMRRERPGHTLQPTALVHEAVAQLLGQDVLARAPDRRYVFAAAARAMRQALVDHARRHGAGKRGGGRRREGLDAVLDYFKEQDVDVVALHEALEELAKSNERASQVVTLRFFGNFTVAEVAELLGVSVATVEGDFRLARAWLRRALGEPT